MDASDVTQWQRAEELAAQCRVRIEVVSNGFLLTDLTRGYMIGRFGTVAETLAFLCGYEHATHTIEEGV